MNKKILPQISRWPFSSFSQLSSYFYRLGLIGCLAFVFITCDDHSESETAQQLKVGTTCIEDQDCQTGQVCLTQFKGGYCGVENCLLDTDCPNGSRCVSHEDGRNYCFLSCTDKSECNADRSSDSEANCSSNIVFTQNPKNSKSCIPPTGSM